MKDSVVKYADEIKIEEGQEFFEDLKNKHFKGFKTARINHEDATNFKQLLRSVNISAVNTTLDEDQKKGFVRVEYMEKEEKNG